MYNPPVFIGLKNYIEVLKGPNIWYALRDVSFYGFIYVFSQTFIGCILAVLLNQKIGFIKTYRIAYFIPVISPWIGISLIWYWLYNPQYGALNCILSFIGVGPFNYTSSNNWAEVVASIAVVTIWKGVGYVTVILLAGLQNISVELMEAAEIDGAGALKRFTKITIPMLSPTIFMVLILGTMSAIQAFDSFFVMLNTSGTGVIPDRFSVFNTLIYDNAFKYNRFGMSAAIAWVAFAFVALLTFIQKKMESRWVHYE